MQVENQDTIVIWWLLDGIYVLSSECFVYDTNILRSFMAEDPARPAMLLWYQMKLLQLIFVHVRFGRCTQTCIRTRILGHIAVGVWYLKQEIWK